MTTLLDYGLRFHNPVMEE